MILPPAIDHHRTALLRLVATLFAASGMVPGQAAALPRIIRGAVLHVLRPAESAVRRLITILAQGLVVPARRVRGGACPAIPKGTTPRAASFRLFDPRKRFSTTARRRFAKHAPSITIIGYDERPIARIADESTVSPDAPVDATRLCRRLEALKRALDDLPREARRLARRRARPQTGLVKAPMRPGRPPGHRARGRHEVDDILRECHTLALMALAAPDTS